MTTTPHVGIAMTTRNRSKTLGLALQHFAHYKRVYPARLWLVDDASDNKHRLTNEALARQFNWNYLRLEDRHGVARAKNAALAQVRDCDNIMLFEDDAWPIADNWDEYLLTCMQVNNCQALNACHPNGMADVHIVEVFGEKDHQLVNVANSTGYVMLWTREALATLGGYDTRMGICGGEDTQMNLRCFNAGFKPYPYCGPALIGQHIYSVDLDWVWGKVKRRPPLGQLEPEGSALTGPEKANGWSIGAKFVHDPAIYQEPLI